MDIEQKKSNHARFMAVSKEAYELRWKKFLLYGDSYKLFSPIGIFIRMSDKMSRIKSILENPDCDCNDERIRDSLIDLSNYAIMMTMEIDDKNDSNKKL
jgi:hypothetical protein